MKRYPKKRRSPRLTLEVPVRVLWHHYKGAAHEEETQTAVVSRYGALLYLSQPLPLDTPLRIASRANNQSTDARVAWTGDTLPDGTTRVGIGFLSPVKPEFWGVMAVRLWEEQVQPA
ncbi:MAG: hypothetical protein ACE5IP_12980, partial [Terriglobia bacterium]